MNLYKKRATSTTRIEKQSDFTPDQLFGLPRLPCDPWAHFLSKLLKRSVVGFPGVAGEPTHRISNGKGLFADAR